MSSKIFQSLAQGKIRHLIQAYETSHEIFWDEDKKKLIHAAEYGEYREKAVIDLLNLFVPQSLSISEGFIITSDGDVSTQCDLIIYDPKSCPRLIDSSHQKFFPIESVVGVGEVKSTIQSQSEMTKILNKLATVKALKDKIKTEVYSVGPGFEKNDHSAHPLKDIYSFVIAKKLPKMPPNGYEYSDSVEQRHKHNLLIGIDNGVGCYLLAGEDTPDTYMYPVTNGFENSQAWFGDFVDEVVPVHFTILLTSISFHCQNAFLFEFDSVYYFTNNY